MMSDGIPINRLNKAALAVHNVLETENIKHKFLGGFELALLGSDRPTKDVDVVIKKPLFTSFDSIVKAFQKADFTFIPGNRTDAIRLIYMPAEVGIDVMLWDLPKNSVILDVQGTALPFYTPTHMFIRKVHCLAERKKKHDGADLLFLYENFKFKDLDWDKIKGGIPSGVKESALQQTAENSAVQGILKMINS